MLSIHICSTIQTYTSNQLKITCKNSVQYKDDFDIFGHLLEKIVGKSENNSNTPSLCCSHWLLQLQTTRW